MRWCCPFGGSPPKCVGAARLGDIASRRRPKCVGAARLGTPGPFLETRTHLRYVLPALDLRCRQIMQNFCDPAKNALADASRGFLAIPEQSLFGPGSRGILAIPQQTLVLLDRLESLRFQRKRCCCSNVKNSRDPGAKTIAAGLRRILAIPKQTHLLIDREESPRFRSIRFCWNKRSWS